MALKTEISQTKQASFVYWYFQAQFQFANLAELSSALILIITPTPNPSTNHLPLEKVVFSVLVL